MVTNECKTDFEKWLEEQPVAPYKAIFWDIPFTVQRAYFELFFDAVGIYITTSKPFIKEDNFYAWCNGHCLHGRNLTREEAYKQAIIKANEIYNENL